MPNLNAALACAQLKQLDKIISDKRELANAYNSFFSETDWCDFFREPDGCISNYWLNAVITQDKKQRDDLLKATNDSGVMTRPAKGRKILENDEGFQFREETESYISNFDAKNDDIGPKNAYFWR